MNSKVNFERKWDARGDDNRGWIDHMLTASVDDVKVGSLCISYIDSGRFPNHYPEGCVSFAYNIKGASTPHDGINKNWIASLYWSIHQSIDSWNDANKKLAQIKEMSEREAFDYYQKELKPAYEKKYADMFMNFKRYHIDFPVVAYSYVKPEFRRQGIGTRLYIEGSRWMRDIGMTLHSSTMQSNTAEGFWKGLLRKGVAIKAKSRKVNITYEYPNGHAPRYIIDLDRL